MLLESFIDDHVKTINILRQIMTVDERFYGEVISMNDHKKANVRILNSIICVIKNDKQLVEFCEVVKSLISVRKQFSIEMLEFETGKD